MKKLISLLLLAALTGVSIAQTGVYTYLTQAVTGSNLRNYKLSGYNGVKKTYRWYEIQSGIGDFSFTQIKSDIERIADSALEIGLQIAVGPGAPIDSTNHWLVDLGLDTFYTTGGGFSGLNNGPYPNYYDTLYTNSFLRLHKALADTLYNLPPYQKAKFKSVFIVFGTTGDPQPYKGTAITTSYGVYEDDAWHAYMLRMADSCASYYAKNAGFLKIAFNPSNSAQNLTTFRTRFPGCMLKHGDASHDYPVFGEADKLTYWPFTDQLYFGEVQDEIVNSPYGSRDWFALILSGLSLKLNRFDWPSGWIGEPDNAFLVNFVKTYTSHFNPSTAGKGFIALAEKPSINDVVTYPEATYGTLISNTTAYNNRLSVIESSGYDELFKKFLRLDAVRDFTNPARITAMEAITGGTFSPETGPFWFNDLGYNTVQNYSLHITQLLIRETSTGAWRIGTSSVYGRAARKAKSYAGVRKLYFDINDALKATNDQDSLRFKIVYYDRGFGKWQLLCYKCFKSTVSNTNSLTFKEAVITVPRFKWGNKMAYGSDFQLKFLSTDVPEIALIQVENLNKD